MKNHTNPNKKLFKSKKSLFKEQGKKNKQILTK